MFFSHSLDFISLALFCPIHFIPSSLWNEVPVFTHNAGVSFSWHQSVPCYLESKQPDTEVVLQACVLNNLRTACQRVKAQAGKLCFLGQQKAWCLFPHSSYLLYCSIILKWNASVGILSIHCSSNYIYYILISCITFKIENISILSKGSDFFLHHIWRLFIRQHCWCTTNCSVHHTEKVSAKSHKNFLTPMDCWPWCYLSETMSKLQFQTHAAFIWNTFESYMC